MEIDSVEVEITVQHLTKLETVKPGIHVVPIMLETAITILVYAMQQMQLTVQMETVILEVVEVAILQAILVLLLAALLLVVHHLAVHHLAVHHLAVHHLLVHHLLIVTVKLAILHILD